MTIIYALFSLSLYLFLRLSLINLHGFFCKVNRRTVQKPNSWMDAIGTKVLRVFLLAVHCPLYYRILLPPLSQDYAQTPQRNCTFMNSASGQFVLVLPNLNVQTQDLYSSTLTIKGYRVIHLPAFHQLTRTLSHILII